MKRVFTKMMLILAVAVMASFVSCKKDKETKYNPDQQKVKLDEVGEAFINEVDLENWKGTLETVAPAIAYLDTADIGIDIDVAAEDTVFNSAKTAAVVNRVIDFSRVKGHFTVNEKNEVEEVKGTFSDFQIAFHAGEQDYTATIEFVNTKNKVLVDSSKRVYSGYDIIKGSKYEWHPVEGGFTKERFTYIILPEKLKVNFLADKAVPFSLEVGLEYAGPDDYAAGIPDMKLITTGVSGALKAGDYTLNLSQFSYKGRNFSEKFNFKRGGKTLLALNSNATLIYYDSAEKVKEDAFKCQNASLSLDILGEVQVKGNLNYDSIMAEIKTMPDSVKSVEEANLRLNALKPYYSLGLYYNGGKSRQASVELEVMEAIKEEADEEAGEEAGEEAEEDYILGYQPVVVVSFPDGTKYAASEFFAPDNFTKTLKAYESLVAKVQKFLLDEGLIKVEEPEESHELHP